MKYLKILGIVVCAIVILITVYYVRLLSILTHVPSLKVKINYDFGNVPRIIHQTWDTADSIPDCCQKVIIQNKALNPSWAYAFYSLVDRRDLIMKYFDSHILDAYDKLPHTTASSDLFRMCCLYVHGGLYIDLKSSCGDLSWLIEKINQKLMYCKWPYGTGEWNHQHHAATSFLLWPAHHPVLKIAIEEAVRRIRHLLPTEIKKFLTQTTGPDLYAHVVCYHVPMEHVYYTDNYFDGFFKHDGTNGEYYKYMKKNKLHWSQQ